jgi:predicted nucleic acid-binding protein
VETEALIRRRLGMAASRRFHADLVPLLTITWVDRAIHFGGLTALLLNDKRDLSLVDCVSFYTMSQLRIQSAIGFDKHFRERGYSLPE